MSNSPSNSSVTTTSGTQEINPGPESSEILIIVQSAIHLLYEPAGLPIPEEHRESITELVISVIWPFLQLNHDQFVAGLISTTNQSQGNDEAIFRCAIIILIIVQSVISLLYEPAGLPIPEEHRGSTTELVISVIWPFLQLNHDQFVAGLISTTNQSQGNDEAVFRCAIIIASLIYSLR